MRTGTGDEKPPIRKSAPCRLGISTYCIENEHQFLHNDGDFDGYERHLGLQVVHP
jgi:hypothetical protein